MVDGAAVVAGEIRRGTIGIDNLLRDIFVILKNSLM
jgi:hypothetical protein